MIDSRVRTPARKRPDVTVIIPAHDESQAIRVTLTHLMHQEFDGRLRIVVVANGCSDDTAEVARSFEHQARESRFELVVRELEEGRRMSRCLLAAVRAILRQPLLHVAQPGSAVVALADALAGATHRVLSSLQRAVRPRHSARPSCPVRAA